MPEIKYKISEDDYIEFCGYNLSNTPLGRKNLNAVRISIPVFAICVLVIMWVLKVSQTLLIIEVALLVPFSVLWVVFAKRILLWNTRRLIKKLKSTGKPPYSEEGTLIFEDESIVDSNDCAETRVKYSAVNKLCVTEAAIYVYFSSMQQAVVLPKSAFENNANMENLIAFLKDKISETAK